MDFVDYREKLGIGFSDEQKYQLLLTKIFNMLNGLIYEKTAELDFKEYWAFCSETGSQVEPRLSEEYVGHERFAHCVSILNSHKNTIEEFLAYFVWLINSTKQEKKNGGDRATYASIIVNALDQCHIPYEALTDNGKLFIFPKGAKELDDALVSEPLEWLQQYPLSRKEWISALKDYANIPAENPSEVADKFRKALERFFQEFFESEKSLENLKSEYGNYLSSKGVPSEIKNNFEKILDLYTNYMNNYAKHHDRTGENVLEYILYQTGNLIRLLITLKQEDK